MPRLSLPRSGFPDRGFLFLSHGKQNMKTASNGRYRLIETPHGPAGFVYETPPFRLKRIYLPLPSRDALFRRMAEDYPLDRLREGDETDETLNLERALSAYFSGRPLQVDWDRLDMAGLTPLQQEVLRAVAAIPFGSVRSYGEIARTIGRPGAARFVGSVMAGNPFPILIPCHRVVRSDGSMGGFGGGTDLKKAMIEMESAAANGFTGCASSGRGVAVNP
jgi:methylated-DNA-[protein]-cysteine S-methyltransferase